ncbi:uncharacterized protein RJT21DRAFT_52302 [Scheffersomyces amazonensis]|uniref:uncharacterized protein n=1 Tax=Scheffersomyces amazonensis TaxID=1078765 RepID=UPI00315CE577
MLSNNQKYDTKRTCDVFLSEDGVNQTYKKVDSPIKTHFWKTKTSDNNNINNINNKTFNYIREIVSFVEEGVQILKKLKDSLKLVEEFAIKQSSDRKGFEEFNRFNNRLEDFIKVTLTSLISLSGFSDLKTLFKGKDLLDLNIFQLAYNAKIENFDFGSIILGSFFSDSSFERIILRYHCKLIFLLRGEEFCNEEGAHILKLPIDYIFSYPTRIKDLINSSSFTNKQYFHQSLISSLSKFNSLKDKCFLLSEEALKCSIKSYTDFDKIDTIVDNSFHDEKPRPRMYEEYDQGPPKSSEDFQVAGRKTKEFDFKKQSKNTKLPSIQKILPSLPLDQSDVGPSVQLLKPHMTLQFKYKFHHLKYFRESMNDHALSLVKFIQTQLKFCEYWQNLLEDKDTVSDSRYITSMYSSFHLKLNNQLNNTYESIVKIIQKEIVVNLDHALAVCKKVDEKLNLHRKRKAHRNASFTELDFELSKFLPGLLLQLDSLVEISLVKFNRAYCKWNEDMIGIRSLGEYNKLIGTYRSSDRKHQDIVDFYKFQYESTMKSAMKDKVSNN